MDKERLVLNNYIQKIAIGNLVLKLDSQLARGSNIKEYWNLYRVVKQFQSAFFWESIKLNADLEYLQKLTLILHHLLEKYTPKKDVEIAGYQIVPVGKVKKPEAISTFALFYGWSKSPTLTESQIESSSNIQSILSGNSFYIPYQTNREFNYLWFAEPITEPVKKFWTETTNPLNKGTINNSGDFFKILIVGKYRLYITDWESRAEGLILFTP